MAGHSDRSDRHEAMRLFIGVAIAVLLLIIVAGIGGYFLIDSVGQWTQETFESGLGLKDSAIIAFVISFIAIIVMAVVSGGHADLFGELPITLMGFFVFFLFCWLMTAWIF